MSFTGHQRPRLSNNPFYDTFMQLYCFYFWHMTYNAPLFWFIYLFFLRSTSSALISSFSPIDLNIETLEQRSLSYSPGILTLSLFVFSSQITDATTLMTMLHPPPTRVWLDVSIESTSTHSTSINPVTMRLLVTKYRVLLLYLYYIVSFKAAFV